MEDKLEKLKKLTKKQKIFADEYIETGNGTKSAKKAYNAKTDTPDNTNAAIASENLKKPNIKVYLDEHVEEAKLRIVELSKSAKNENVRYSANKDIIDRNRGKAPQGIDITSDGDKLEAGIVILPILEHENSSTKESKDSVDA